jgi:hypothetical protein
MTTARRKSRVRENRSGDTSFVTVVGGANIDIHGKSTRALRANDSNPGTVCISAGGVARNIAENLVRLGVDCRLITAVGHDHNGRTLIRLADEAGIDTRYVQEIASAQTSTYLSVIDASGDMTVAIADMDITDQLTPARLRPYQSMLNQSSLIVLDTNLPDSTLAWLAREFPGPRSKYQVTAARCRRTASCCRRRTGFCYARQPGRVLQHRRQTGYIEAQTAKSDRS